MQGCLDVDIARCKVHAYRYAKAYCITYYVCGPDTNDKQPCLRWGDMRRKGALHAGIVRIAISYWFPAWSCLIIPGSDV